MFNSPPCTSLPPQTSVFKAISQVARLLFRVDRPPFESCGCYFGAVITSVAVELPSVAVEPE